MQTRLSRLSTLSSISVFAVSSIFLFGPFTVYQGNTDEIAVPFGSILVPYILPALTLVSAFIGIGLSLPEKAHRRYASASGNAAS